MKITFLKYFLIFVVFLGLLFLVVITTTPIVKDLNDLTDALRGCINQNVELLNQILDEKDQILEERGIEEWSQEDWCFKMEEAMGSFDSCIDTVKNKNNVSKFFTPLLIRVAFLGKKTPKDIKEEINNKCIEYFQPLARETYFDESTGFKIKHPNNWKKSSDIPDYVLELSREDKFASIRIGLLYIQGKPEGVNTLEDWEELKIQESDYGKLGLEKQFIEPYYSNYEEGVRCKLKKRWEEYDDYLVVEEYMFSNFLNDENDRKLWLVIAQFTEKRTPETTKKEIEEIVNSFDVQSYKW